MYYSNQDLHQVVGTKKAWENQKGSSVGHESGERKDKFLKFMTQLNRRSKKNPNPPGLVGRTLKKSGGSSAEGAGMFLSRP